MKTQSSTSAFATVAAVLSGSMERRTILVKASVATKMYFCVPSLPLEGPYKSA